MINGIRASDIELILARTALARVSESVGASRSAAFGREPDQRAFKTLTLDYLSALMKLPEIDYSARETDMRLRVAMHLSCPAAVDYDSLRTEPRWAVIQAHLRQHFPFTDEESERVARLVATVLDDWDARRQRGLELRRSKLLERQGYRCASCRLHFADSTRVSREEAAALSDTADPFKPYFDGNGVQAAMAPEVDHITVVSKDGTNRSENLQILCALCNQGKGDSSGVRSSRELQYCYMPIEEIPRGHRMSLLYYRLKMDRSTCASCGSQRDELTVRMERDGGLITLTNLRSICYSCLS